MASQHNTKTSDAGKVSQSIVKASDVSSNSNVYKPSDLLLKLDFEAEEVKPLKGKKNNPDQLVVYTPEGRKSAVGIMYEGGDLNDRRAQIIADPTNEGNQVFHFWLKNARVHGQRKGKNKGRVQLNLTALDNASLFQRYRMYLHPDMALYKKFPKMNSWFTVNEMWMGDRWKDHPYPFRLSLKIGKTQGVDKPLYFLVVASFSDAGKSNKSKWKQAWAAVAPGFEIPVGEWLDIEIGYKAGDNNTGRFYMAVKGDSEDTFTTVFDITNWTYHPGSPDPVSMSSWQPLKVYTSSKIVDFIRNNGGMTQLYFDDVEIYDNW